MTADHPHGHGHHDHHHDEPIGPEEAVRSLLLLGQTALDAGDFESAVIAYESVLKIEQDETALINLGSLYARGLGRRVNAEQDPIRHSESRGQRSVGDHRNRRAE